MAIRCGYDERHIKQPAKESEMRQLCDGVLGSFHSLMKDAKRSGASAPLRRRLSSSSSGLLFSIALRTAVELGLGTIGSWALMNRIV